MAVKKRKMSVKQIDKLMKESDKIIEDVIIDNKIRENTLPLPNVDIGYDNFIILIIQYIKNWYKRVF